LSQPSQGNPDKVESGSGAAIKSAKPEYKIGVYGGSFDPVHLGHLRSALEVMQIKNLHQLRFLPSGNPPHRAPAQAADKHRLRMLQLAVQGEERICIDTRELEREDTSYTIDTLQSVQADYPHADLTLIIGMDQFSAFDTWHRWQELLQRVELVVMERPGETMSDSARKMIDSPLQQRITVVRVTQMEISSSRIRQDLQAGLDIRFLVPYAVHNYIRTESLYSTVE